MRFDGYDFIIVGLVLGVGGALLFGKAYLMPSYPMELAGTYLDHNPFQVRNTIIARHEAVAGAIWLVAGLLFSLIGTVRSVRSGQTGYLIGCWFDIVVLLAAGLVLWRVTIGVTDRTSRAEYVPIISQMMREAFSVHGHTIRYGGLNRDERARGIVVSPETARKRIDSARDSLDRIGKLVDAPRIKGEDDTALVRRLSAYFPGIGFD